MNLFYLRTKCIYIGFHVKPDLGLGCVSVVVSAVCLACVRLWIQSLVLFSKPLKKLIFKIGFQRVTEVVQEERRLLFMQSTPV